MDYKTTKPTLVIGGGISGITAAVEIAEVGKKVILVEQKPYLGGNVIRMNNYFPKLCPPLCGLEINFRRIRQNSRIEYYTSSKVINISGQKGNYKIKILTEPQYIKNNCTACGKCSEVCPEVRPDDFNNNFSSVKAVYLPHEDAFPLKYYIDENYCKKETCKKCVDACEYNAIDFSAKPTETEVEISNIVVATGWENYNASKIEYLKYGVYPNVITNMEFERLISANGPGKGILKRPTDSKTPKDIVFVQCAGSRDENHLPYCSAVCCTASIKHALTLQEKYPDSKIKIFYIDLRVSGRNEDFLNKAIQNNNIELIKGKVAKISNAENENLIVEAENILSGKKVSHETELVVLATGMVPLKTDFKTGNTPEGFITGKPEEGIFAISCCKKPMDVSTSVKEATGAALKAIQA